MLSISQYGIVSRGQGVVLFGGSYHGGGHYEVSTVAEYNEGTHHIVPLSKIS